jgi:hypothetical protein
MGASKLDPDFCSKGLSTSSVGWNSMHYRDEVKILLNCSGRDIDCNNYKWSLTPSKAGFDGHILRPCFWHQYNRTVHVGILHIFKPVFNHLNG